MTASRYAIAAIVSEFDDHGVDARTLLDVCNGILGSAKRNLMNKSTLDAIQRLAEEARERLAQA